MLKAFTKETAREAQAKSVIARQAKRLAEATHEKRQAIADYFQERRLVRVRKQIEMLADLIDKELMGGDCDAGKIDRMASAAVRLNELERQYSNRSLPPVLKATPVKPKKAGSANLSPEPD